MSELVGRVFAGYRIESVIGRGAMGTVYLAEDERLQRKVALKVLAPELVHQDAFWQRFLRETRIATALDHPHVVPVYDAGDAEGTPFLAMRYVEGSDLRALLRRAGPLEPRRALAIVAQVARALDAAHARGLVHRDVKPGNVLIAEDEHAYLADFGVSLELDAQRSHPGSPVGTVAYLAPEQIEGATVDGRADQYALACVLFECVCGEPPFTRADSDMAVLWAHLEGEPRSLGELRPGLPAPLDAVLAKALAKDPRARFATCQAFIDAAMEALGESAALPPALAAQRAPLIGRADELAWLREAWARKGVALLSGPRGSGKTRLAAELARIAQADGAEVHYASCLDGPPPAVGEGLLVIEDLDAAGDDVLREAGDSVLVLGTRRTDAPGYRRLEPLDRRALRELIALYTDATDAPVDRIAQATGGLPGPAHELAAEWARAEVARRVRASADRAADERTSLRDAESDLAQDVIEIQLVRERARLYVPEAQTSARSQTACPFIGLGSFGANDADVFFGRERLVAQLVAALAGSRFLAIVGPSGSGKSSALRAGLLPALAGGVLPGSEQWEPAVIRPGERVPATGLVAVDQFEELFTGVLDEDERAAFIASIAASAAVVVVALRADFYGRCSAYPELRDLLANHHVLVGPMTADELRRTIELPAAGAGLRVERELADALVRDVSGEPGALPLLSTALVELWRARDGTTLTIDAYERSGGVRGAVARMAEAAYDELDAALRPACRALLLRMVSEEPGVGVVRRRVPLSELELDTREDTRAVLAALTDRRLVTVGEHGAEIAHEALLAEWPRLRDWLQSDADGRLIRQHLASAANEWDEADDNPDLLYRGSRLADVNAWASEHKDALSTLEAQFLKAGSRRERTERRRRRRRLRATFSVITLLALAGLAAAVMAARQRDDAQRQARTAQSRELAATAVERSALDPTLGLLLALESYRREPTREASDALRRTLIQHHQRAVLPAPPPYSFGASPDHRLLAATDGGTTRVWDLERRRLLATLPTPGMLDVRLLAGTRLVVWAGDKPVAIWDWRERREIRRLPFHATEGFFSLEASPDGRWIAWLGDHPAVWDLESERAPIRLHGLGNGEESGAFSADGRRFAVASSRGTDIYRLPDGARLRTVRTAPASWIKLSRDGSTMLITRPTTQPDRTEFWNLRTGKRRVLAIGETGAPAFSRDGRHAIIGTSGPTQVISLSDLRNVRPDPEALRPAEIGKRSADGQFVLTSDSPPTVVSTITGETVAELRESGVDARAFSFIADGTGVLTGDDRRMYFWELPLWTAVRTEPEQQRESEDLLIGGAGSRLTLTQLRGSRARVWRLGLDGARFTVDRMRPTLGGRSFGLSANGRFVLTADADGRTTIRDVATWRPLHRLRASSTPAYVRFEPMVSVPTAGAVSDDGRVAVADLGDRFIVWDAASGRELSAPRPPAPRLPPLPPVILSPDGRRIVASIQDSSFSDPAHLRPGLRLLDARTGLRVRDLPQAGGMVSGAFARDGRFVTVGYDLRVRLWSSDGHLLHILSSGDQMSAAAFDPTGRYLAAAGKLGVQVWDARSGAPIAMLPLASGVPNEPSIGDDRRPAAVVWSGRTIVLANPNGIVRALECVVCRPVAELVAVAKAQLPRQLTAAERRTYLHEP